MEPRYAGPGSPSGQGGPPPKSPVLNSQDEFGRFWEMRERLEMNYQRFSTQFNLQSRLGMARDMLACCVEMRQRYRMIDLPDIARKNEVNRRCTQSLKVVTERQKDDNALSASLFFDIFSVAFDQCAMLTGITRM